MWGKKYATPSHQHFTTLWDTFCKLITDQKINIIISTVSLFHKIRSWNKNNINNYVEIYVKAKFDKILKLKKKYFYIKKRNNVIGKDIKPQFPKNPNIIIENNFNKSLNSLSNELIKKIKTII